MSRSWLLARLARSACAVALSTSAGACLPEGPIDALGVEADTDTDTDADLDPPTWHALVRSDDWQPQAAEDDPAPDHRPAIVECPGWYPEGGGLEIDTGACNYLSLQQPLLDAIEPGDPVHLELWWQTLASVEPAEGHLAVYVGDALLWEEHVPIPGPAAARSLDFASPVGAPAGAPLTLHLHNHGYNTWHFHELIVFRTPQ